MKSLNIKKKFLQACCNICFLLIVIALYIVKYDKGNVQASDEIICTHIWANTYDDTYHWEYCTACATVRNKVEHSLIEKWFNNQAHCHWTNYCNAICECGYNKTYREPHGEKSNFIGAGNRLVHYNKCLLCATWIDQEQCYDETNTRISCANPGVCVVCNFECSGDNHKVNSNGRCANCGQQIITIVEKSLNYAEDYSYAEIEFIVDINIDNVIPAEDLSYITSTANFSRQPIWSREIINEKKYKYKVRIYFNEHMQQKCMFNIGCSSCLKVNGTSVFVEAGIVNYEIWQDHEKPTVTNVIQKPNSQANEWSTINEILISGTENLSDTVKISVKNKETGVYQIQNAAIVVVDNSFSYSRNIPLDGTAEGVTYVAEVEDLIGNKDEYEFVVYNTDKQAPVLESQINDVEWTKESKIVNLSMYDYGSGEVKTSLGNQTSYKATTLVNEKYTTSYTFDNDIYGAKVHKLYMKDALGNTSVADIIVGNIDKTNPTISDLIIKQNLTNATITVRANDMNSLLGEEGSGVFKYAMKTDISEPMEADWQTSQAFDVEEDGTYYFWVKDLVGNVSQMKNITYRVDEWTTKNPEINVEEGIYTENKSVELSCITEEAEIYYTLDGSEPTKESTLYTGPIMVTGIEQQSIVTTINAKAFREGFLDSQIMTWIYTINIPKTILPPTIIKQPQQSEVNEGDSAIFEVNAVSDGVISYQWMLDRGDGKGWNILIEGIGARYEIKESTLLENGYKYKCVVTNTEEGKIRTVETEAAKLLVNDIKDGEIKENVDDKAEGKLGNNIGEIKELILTKEDIKRLERGENVEIHLEINDIDEREDTSVEGVMSDISLIKEEMTRIEGYVLGKYMDISLYKQIGLDEAVKIDKCRGNIRIEMSLSQELINEDNTIIRDYKIIRVHNGEVKILETTYDKENAKLLFETDRFSTYAVIYNDEKVEQEADTSIKDKTEEDIYDKEKEEIQKDNAEDDKFKNNSLEDNNKSNKENMGKSPATSDNNSLLVLLIEVLVILIIVVRWFCRYLYKVE